MGPADGSMTEINYALWGGDRVEEYDCELCGLPATHFCECEICYMELGRLLITKGTIRKEKL